jgi:hypothetical protein
MRAECEGFLCDTWREARSSEHRPPGHPILSIVFRPLVQRIAAHIISLRRGAVADLVDIAGKPAIGSCGNAEEGF